MAYEDSTDSEAAEPQPDETDSEGSGRDDTFFIPPDLIPNADTLKPGEELVFKFLGRDKDGHLEVEYAHDPQGGEEPSWQDEMRGAVAEKGAM